MSTVCNWSRASSRRFVARAPLRARWLLQCLPLAAARFEGSCHA